MTFVTKLRLQSGDRAVLDDVVGELKEWLERKGAECRGPHAASPRRLRVPQYRRLAPGDEFEPWTYTVYERSMAIHGSDHVAREVGHREFPDSVHVEITVEQKSAVGSNRSS
jgi:ribosomal protein S10